MASQANQWVCVLIYKCLDPDDPTASLTLFKAVGYGRNQGEALVRMMQNMPIVEDQILRQGYEIIDRVGPKCEERYAEP